MKPLSQRFRRTLALTALLWLTTPASADNHDEISGYIAEAREFLDQGQVAAGVIQLKNALQQAPDSAEARFLLGRAYMRLGNPRSAEKELRRAAELGWPRAQTLPLLARSLLLNRKFQQLLKDIFPNPSDDDLLSGDLLAMRGMAELFLQRFDKAERSLQKAQRLNPQSVEATFGLARLALARNDRDTATARLAEALERAPERVDGWLLSGQLAQATGRPEEALEAFEEALQRQPGNGLARLGRALNLLALDRQDEALEAAEDTLAVAVNQPDANFVKAQVFYSRGDFDATEAVLADVFAVRPDHAGAQLLQGALHYHRGNLSQAEDSLRRVVRLRPDYLPAVKLLAATLTRAGKPEQTIELLAPLADGPAVQSDAIFYSLLGGAYLLRGEFEKGSERLARAAELAPDASRILTQLALSKIGLGQNEEALMQLQSAVDLGQDLIQAELLLIASSLRQRDFDRAAETARALAERRPDDPRVQNLLGAVYLAQGDHDAARERLQRLLDNDPANLPVMQTLAELAGRVGDTAAVRRWLEQAWQMHPESARTGATLVRFYLHAGEPLPALKLARDLGNRFPQTPEVLDALGRALIANDNAASAIDAFATLTEQQPDLAAAWLQLGLAQLGGGASASAALDKALALDPTLLRARSAKAFLALREQRPADALAESERIKQRYPDQPIGYRLAGDALRALDRGADALPEYRRAFELGPSAQTAAALSEAQFAGGRIDDATATLQGWLERAPDDDRARLVLGTLLLKQGQSAQAIEQYRQLLQRQPDSVSALNNLAWLYGERGDLKKSLEYARRASQLAPQRGAITDTLGWALVQNDQIEQGLQLLERAVAQAPEIADIHYHLAIVYERLGRDDEARQSVDAALANAAALSDEAAARALQQRLR